MFSMLRHSLLINTWVVGTACWSGTKAMIWFCIPQCQQICIRLNLKNIHSTTLSEVSHQSKNVWWSVFGGYTLTSLPAVWENLVKAITCCTWLHWRGSRGITTFPRGLGYGKYVCLAANLCRSLLGMACTDRCKIPYISDGDGIALSAKIAFYVTS